jgi:asparagine synthase (glutamine-hydrolysing)
LLDFRIIEYLATLPPEEKIPHSVPKALLREVARPVLPERIVHRNDKTGFPVPYREWVAAQLGPQIRRLLASEPSMDRGIFDQRVLRDPDLSPDELLSMMNIEVWFRVFIDRDPDWLPSSSGAGRMGFASLPPL